MDYFSACPSKGKDYMKLCLERVPLETERKAVKVLRVCEQYQLIDTGIYVYTLGLRLFAGTNFSGFRK